MTAPYNPDINNKRSRAEIVFFTVLLICDDWAIIYETEISWDAKLRKMVEFSDS